MTIWYMTCKRLLTGLRSWSAGSGGIRTLLAPDPEAGRQAVFIQQWNTCGRRIARSEAKK